MSTLILEQRVGLGESLARSTEANLEDYGGTAPSDLLTLQQLCVNIVNIPLIILLDEPSLAQEFF